MGQAVLELLGYEVVVCDDSHSTFEALDREPPDVLMVDYDMRTEDGTPVVWRVALTEAFEHVPMLVLLDKGQQPEVFKPFLRSHVISYTHYWRGKRPFGTEELATMLNQLHRVAERAD
jgi:DNA-binding response OmpR family regulator